MDKTIAEAYVRLYNHAPEPDADEWQTASDILDRWDVPRLGENLAKETLSRIIANTPFPDDATALLKANIERAKEKMEELEKMESRPENHEKLNLK